MSIEAKMAAGQRAIEWIKHGMIVGLGSGSTAECFIKSLIESDLRVQAVASSRASTELAKRGGIDVLDINSVSHIDITVDGADEIDSQKRMIKGGGGAHVREKILASSSNLMLVVVDETKLVPSIGTKKLPIEVMFYGSAATKVKIETFGHPGKWRMNPDGTLFITENGNLLLDLYFDLLPKRPEDLHEALLNIPGVVDTGFFFHLAGPVIVGYSDGSTEVRQ